MISLKLFGKCLLSCQRANVRFLANERNPYTKTWNVLKNDLSVRNKKKDIDSCPEHADVVIIGGGFIGSSIAYWLKTRASHGLSIVVLEKDFTYKEAHETLPQGTLNSHFSLPENVLLSQYSMEFLRNIKEHLNLEDDIEYLPTSSLILASEKYADKLEENVSKLQEFGIKNHLLTSESIKKVFPQLNTNDIKLGCMGVEGEGLYNSWALLKGFIKKSRQLGAQYLNAEVTGFQFEELRDVLMEGVSPGSYERMTHVNYKTPDNKEHSIKFAICVLAAGDASGDIAKMAKIGCKDGILNIALPIEKRQHQIYSIQDAPTNLFTPITTDTTGLWLMKNGLDNNLLFGNPPLNSEQNSSEEDHFNNIVKPSLLNRLPNCANANIITKHKCEKYDCNTFDNNGIIGPHPYYNSLYLATGFGKLGCHHAPGIGRAIAELIIDSQFMSIDLTRFGFDRLITNEPIVEFNVY